MNVRIAVSVFLGLSLFLPIIVNSQVVNLDCVGIQDSFVIQTQEVFAGQYPCLPTTSNGSRTLLRFATVLNNLNSVPVRISPYKLPVRILYSMSFSSVVVRSGYLNVTCLRDTFCGKRPPRYTRCDIGGLNSKCNMSLDHRLPCQWIDITGLLINNLYDIEMSLIPALDGSGMAQIDTTPCTFSVVPANFDTLTVGGWRMMLVSFLVILGIPVVVIFVTCLCHNMRKPGLFSVYDKSLYNHIKWHSD